MAEKFYVTTPIYYVNDQPHIGHAYTTVAADVLARYHRMRGDDVYFLTGTDEHGQKVQQAAEARGISPLALADRMSDNFRNLWERLNVTPDAFMRTSDAGHKRIVQDTLSELWQRGEIEKRSYTGWYCTPDERFWTEKDLADGNCPDCGRKVQSIEEENYFFLMSRYGERLIKYIEDNPGFILPESRRNEVLGFLRSQPLGDLCISRPVHRLSWGIPLPFDPEFVTYVWFDALLNYYSAPQYIAGRTDLWPAEHHLIGKDILTTHAVYWSTMLMAMGKPMPRNIFAHGWWTIEGRKMSKSLGNAINPIDLVDNSSADRVRYFLMREVPFGLDGDYSEVAFTSRCDVDLSNDLGNLASRVHKMIVNYCEGKVPSQQSDSADMRAYADVIKRMVDKHLNDVQFHRALDEIWKLVTFTNKYITTNEPWVLAKDQTQKGRLDSVLYHTAEALRFLSVYLMPFIPDAMTKLRTALGQGAINPEVDFMWGQLKCGTQLGPLEPLFPRNASVKIPTAHIKAEGHMLAVSISNKEIKMTEPENAPQAAPVAEGQSAPAAIDAAPAEAPAAPEAELLPIDDFMKIELKTAKIIEAERVPKSKKLVRLQVDCGGMRQIVAGIGAAYAPEDLIGKTIIIVANLKPAKLMGVESQGMLLAATDEDGVPILLTAEKEVRTGLRVK